MKAELNYKNSTVDFYNFDNSKIIKSIELEDIERNVRKDLRLNSYYVDGSSSVINKNFNVNGGTEYTKFINSLNINNEIFYEIQDGIFQDSADEYLEKLNNMSIEELITEYKEVEPYIEYAEDMTKEIMIDILYEYQTEEYDGYSNMYVVNDWVASYYVDIINELEYDYQIEIDDELLNSPLVNMIKSISENYIEALELILSERTGTNFKIIKFKILPTVRLDSDGDFYQQVVILGKEYNYWDNSKIECTIWDITSNNAEPYSDSDYFDLNDDVIKLKSSIS